MVYRQKKSSNADGVINHRAISARFYVRFDNRSLLFTFLALANKRNPTVRLTRDVLRQISAGPFIDTYLFQMAHLRGIQQQKKLQEIDVGFMI